MFLTDDGGHFVRKVTLDGKVLLELGVPGKPAPYERRAVPSLPGAHDRSDLCIRRPTELPSRSPAPSSATTP